MSLHISSSVSRLSLYSSRIQTSSIPLLFRRSNFCTLQQQKQLITGVLLTLQTRHFASTGNSSGPTNNNNNINNDEYIFDPTISIQKDAAMSTAKKSLENILRELLPTNAPDTAKQKVKNYLQQHPIDTLITQPKVQITHVEENESGIEKKISLSPCDFSEALEQAQEREMNLVQMGARGDVAYCRIRKELPRILSLVSEELEALRKQEEAQEKALNSNNNNNNNNNNSSKLKPKELIVHQFRDVVDAHFVGWRSKKIVEDIKKRHTVKVVIKEFQSPDSAISKLQEMCQAMLRYAEEKVIYHHFTSIVANDREVSITFAPSLPTNNNNNNNNNNAWKHIKYPGEKEWAHARRRMEEACRKSGRHGTYVRNNALKPRSLGQTLFRVDKYGRKMD